jgi:putative Mn2+ efflux pump MntP
MKTSSANANPEPPSVQTARGMVAANLAVPGFGSLMAKRAAGWPQAALTIVGFALTSIFGVRFIIWFLQHLNTLYGAESDPLESLLDLWRNVRWALLGIGLFAMSWLWSLATNAEILRSAKRDNERAKPPVLQ